MLPFYRLHVQTCQLVHVQTCQLAYLPHKLIFYKNDLHIIAAETTQDIVGIEHITKLPEKFKSHRFSRVDCFSTINNTASTLA